MTQVFSIENYEVVVANRNEVIDVFGLDKCGCEKCIVVYNNEVLLVTCVEKGKIWASFVMGKLKEPMNIVTKLINIKNVVFCNIINPALIEKLKNIKKIFKIPDDKHGEETICIEVEWEATHSENVASSYMYQ